MPTVEETQAAAAVMAANNPYVNQQPQQSAPPPQQQPAQQQPAQGQAPTGQQPSGQQQPAQQPHPDFAKGPAQPGEHRPANIWIPPDEWAQTQAEIRSMREWKQKHDQELEAKERERLKVMAEKGQIEQALNEVNAMHEKKQHELQTKLEQRERAWLAEKTTQAINEVMAGRTFIGQNEEARNRTAGMVRKLLELEIESVIGPTGAPITRDRVTLRPAADYLKERLTSPESEFAAFLAPNKPSGGSGTDGTRPPATPNTPPPVALSPDETVKAWQATKQPIASFGLFPQQRKA